ncbi:MAG TPA: hypothetical protein VJP88_05455, partial [Caulobacteraceae bacterium]|nr:hypothetical protein [Caulobacteraceae bacterium]
MTSERISGNSACGAAISKQGHSHGKWYAEIVVPEFDGRAGAAGQLNIDAAISPQIDTNLSNSFAYGEIAGMGICFGDDSGGPNIASYDNNPGHSSVSGFGTSLSSTGGVAQVAADLDNWLVWFGMNGTWWGVDGSYNPVSGAQANPSTRLHGIPIIHTIYYVGFQAVWTGFFSSGP